MPLAIVDVDGLEALAGPATLALLDRTGRAANRDAVLAWYDESTHEWIAAGTVGLPSSGLTERIAVANVGQYALLVADDGPGGPASAASGQPLTGAPAVTIPFDASAIGRVVPEVGRADDPTPAQASVTITAATALRSGTLLRGDFTEVMLLRAGCAAPLQTAQDLFAYRLPGDDAGSLLAATFPIAPSRSLTEISEGTISVDLSAGAGVDRSLPGFDRGGVIAADGVRVTVPTGAFATDAFDLAPHRGTSIPGCRHPPGSNIWSRSESRFLRHGGRPGAGTHARGRGVARADRYAGDRRRSTNKSPGRNAWCLSHLLACKATPSLQSLICQGLRLPGATRPGRYGFYALAGTVVIVRGTARDEAGRRAGHLVEIRGPALVSTTRLEVSAS